MPGHCSLTISCRSPSGSYLGELTIADRRGHPSLLDTSGSADISVSELSEYVLLLRHAAPAVGGFAAPVEASPVQGEGEIFGILGQRPGLGELRLGLEGHDHSLLWQRTIYIRPEKLKDRLEFEEMVADICDWRTSLALDLQSYSSAPWSLDLESSATQPEELLVVLRSVIETHDLFGNIELVQRRAQARLDRDQAPGRMGQERIEPFRFGMHLNAPGKRLRVPLGHALSEKLGSLPADAPTARKIENIDTPANQFVKFVLQRIRSLLSEALASRVYPQSPLVAWAKRAESSARRLATNQFYSRVSGIAHLDLGSPVLQNREGYRAILRAYLRLRAGLSIRWPELSETVFGETRDVAQLYEIWCLIELRRALARLGAQLTLGHFECTKGRLRLVRGSCAEAAEPIEICGRSYRLQLHYNRTFVPALTWADDQSAHHSDAAGTWSKVMKPDFTIALFPSQMTATAAMQAAELRLVHLDAKYRLKKLSPLLVEEGTSRTYAPDDLDKMHAYAAAINGSRGAYALYPGDETTLFLRSDLQASIGAIAARARDASAMAPAIQRILDLAIDQPSVRL